MKGILIFFQLNQERCSRRKYDWDYRYLSNEFDGARPLLQQKGVSGDLWYTHDNVNLSRKVYYSALYDIFKTASIPRRGFSIF